MTSARFASLAACSILPVGRQATSPADVSSPSAGAFYSAEAFVNAWIGKPEPRPAVVRDYSFKAIIGEVPF